MLWTLLLYFHIANVCLDLLTSVTISMLIVFLAFQILIWEQFLFLLKQFFSESLEW